MHYVGEVDKRSGQGGDRDAPMLVAIRIRQPSDADVDTRAAPLDRGRDLGSHRTASTEAPERCGRSVAQDGVVAAREHGRMPQRRPCPRPVAHRVDAAVHRDQPTRPDLVIDCPSTEAYLEQLPAGHQPVL
jgi:hypothetical protein